MERARTDPTHVSHVAVEEEASPSMVPFPVPVGPPHGRPRCSGGSGGEGVGGSVWHRFLCIILELDSSKREITEKKRCILAKKDSAKSKQ